MRKRKNAGFTLVELILVLIILSVLAAIVVPNVVGRGKEGKIGATKTQIAAFKTALDEYALDNHSEYPTTEQGLKALAEKPSSPPVPKKWKHYLDEIPKDPWGNPYKYERPGKHYKHKYDVWSMGPDGLDGTEDDIGNWNLSDTDED